MIKNINLTIVCLTIISLYELYLTHKVDYSLALWIGYAIYRGIRWMVKQT